VRRRYFIAIAGCALTTRPLAGVAQQSPKQLRIAIVIPTGNTDQIVREDGLGIWPGFLSELRRLGYIEGGNLVVERYSAEDRREPGRLDEFVAGVVNRLPTLIVTVPNPLARRFVENTKSIPIVAIMADPVEYGLVTSLAHPGGNLTGVSVNAGREIWGKRLQIIKDVVPTASRIGYLGVVIPSSPSPNLSALQTASERFGVSVTDMSVTQSTEAAYRETFAAIQPGSPDAIILSDVAEVTPYRRLIAELASAHRVPTMFPFADDVIKRGALMAYGTDLEALGRRLGAQVVKILEHIKPADIPIEQASRFVFAINVKTAAAMGFTFPPAMVARADEVIQ
jgi:putative tryptophan/tyrosine transport system substrate-binding protein